jgi:hypothetical protein
MEVWLNGLAQNGRRGRYDHRENGTGNPKRWDNSLTTMKEII